MPLRVASHKFNTPIFTHRCLIIKTKTIFASFPFFCNFHVVYISYWNGSFHLDETNFNITGCTMIEKCLINGQCRFDINKEKAFWSIIHILYFVQKISNFWATSIFLVNIFQLNIRIFLLLEMVSILIQTYYT